MTSRANCCVAGCNSMYKNNPELTFHHFPSDSQKIEHVDEFGIVLTVYRKKMWEIKLKMGKRVTRNMRVCSRHFVEQDFITPSDCKCFVPFKVLWRTINLGRPVKM
jgi:hypothetical protein